MESSIPSDNELEGKGGIKEFEMIPTTEIARSLDLYDTFQLAIRFPELNRDRTFANF